MASQEEAGMETSWYRSTGGTPRGRAQTLPQKFNTSPTRPAAQRLQEEKNQRSMDLRD